MKSKRNYVKSDQKRKAIGENEKKNRHKAFDEVKDFSMINPWILNWKGFKIIQEKDLSGIVKGLAYFCNIYHTCEYREIILIPDQSGNDQGIVEKCDTEKLELICRSCDTSSVSSQ